MFSNDRMHTLCSGLLGWLLLAAAGLAQPLELDLLATLADADAPFFDKAQACKRLAVEGSEQAVPVLAGLLDDEKLSHYARYGLEPIPSPRVDEVLAAALGTLQGRHLIGVINSIGNRGKPAAIDALAGKLNDPDRAVATAAAHSIARIGTPRAGEILGDAMSAQFAAACLVCGKTLAGQGHTAEAVALLTKLQSLPDAPPHVRTADLLQSIDLQGSAGIGMLTDALQSDDRRTFQTALRTARLLKPADAAQAALAAMEDAPPARAAPLVTLLGDLADPAGLPAIVQAAGSANPVVRIAALEALVSLGTADHVPLLMDAALDDSAETADRARQTLAALSGDAVDQAVLDQLNDPARQAMVIQLIGERRITAAVPRLLALIDGPHQLEVVAALGETLSLDELDVLGKLLGAESSEVRESARTALHAACYRMPDRDATAAKLAGYLPGASEETVAMLMDELRLVGGDTALAAVAKAANSDNDLQQDYATRSLGEWLDTSAAPVLLALAKSEGDSKYGIRAIRGYIRLARQFSMPDEQRAAMCRTAVDTADRDSEKKLVLEVVQRYPSIDMLKIAVDLADVPALKSDAAAAALVVAQDIGVRSAEVQSLLAQVGQDAVKVEIIKAEYGSGTQAKDVTDVLRKHVRGFPLIVLPSPKYNTVFGGDPAPSVRKQLKIEYRLDGKPGSVTLSENATILLPIPK